MEFKIIIAFLDSFSQKKLKELQIFRSAISNFLNDFHSIPAGTVASFKSRSQPRQYC